MDANEEYVRSKWDCCRYQLEADGYAIILADGMFARVGIYRQQSEAQAWSAAAEFTRQREEEIRCASQDVFSLNEQIDTNVDILHTMPEIDAPFSVSIGEDLARLGRILAREQDALADLKRGMKSA